VAGELRYKIWRKLINRFGRRRDIGVQRNKRAAGIRQTGVPRLHKARVVAGSLHFSTPAANSEETEIEAIRYFRYTIKKGKE
jgi:DNA-binding IclR family transcriptional regulator